MFKKSLVVFALIQSSYSIAEEVKKPNYLHWKMNEHVIITISNIECPFPQMKSKYPYAATASRIDGQRLVGCFKQFDQNDIEIQWYKGDKSVLPANVFLQKPIELKIEPVPTL